MLMASRTMPNKEDFAAMLDETFSELSKVEGTVIKGTVVAIENDFALIDVGLKTEGRVALKEFASPGQAPNVKVGDMVDVYLDRIENALGEAMLSREKARREESWTDLERGFNEGKRVDGVIFGRVKGGFTVDLNGAVAFLPGSQVDIRPVRDVTPLLGIPQAFQILKMDKRRGNIVVSRRAVMEEARAEQRSELLVNLKEGQILDGVVKNITDYGAFVDLGGVDGLLHVTDIAWQRINHPSEALSIGDTIKVQVIKVNPETQRISLGMKQLQSDPWDTIAATFPVNSRLKGRVTNITDYGAFVELQPGIEGLVHVSEMSWTKKNVHPGKIVSTSQEVEVQVLDVDPKRRRISLGLKQCMENPWEGFAKRYPVGAGSKARSAILPSSACLLASKKASTAWCTCRIWRGTKPRKRPWPSITRAPWSRRKCSKLIWKKNVSVLASNSWFPIRSMRRRPPDNCARGKSSPCGSKPSWRRESRFQSATPACGQRYAAAI